MRQPGGAILIVGILIVGVLAGSCRSVPVAPTPTAPALAVTPDVPCIADAGDAAAVPRRVPAPTMSYRGADWLTRPERIREEDPDRMIDALHLRPGLVVADIGAGVGYHVWRMAPRVLPEGRVFAADLQPEMLAELDRNVKARGLTNVTQVLSTATATGLPANTIDLALMADVYHELAQPEIFLADIRRALRPDGRLVLVEFRDEGDSVPIRKEHRMTAAQVIAELGASGFCLVERYDELPWQHLLVFATRARD